MDVVGAILSLEGTNPIKEEKEKLRRLRDSPKWKDKYILLCRACGWTVQNETGSSYLPQLRILDSRENSGLWAMGND